MPRDIWSPARAKLTALRRIPAKSSRGLLSQGLELEIQTTNSSALRSAGVTGARDSTRRLSLRRRLLLCWWWSWSASEVGLILVAVLVPDSRTGNSRPNVAAKFHWTPRSGLCSQSFADRAAVLNVRRARQYTPWSAHTDNLLMRACLTERREY
jgi:hypothetical protein